MLRNGLSGGVEMLGNGIGRHRLQRDQCNDRSPCRIGYSLKNVSFHNPGWDYATKRLQMQAQPNGFLKLAIKTNCRERIFEGIYKAQKAVYNDEATLKRRGFALYLLLAVGRASF